MKRKDGFSGSRAIVLPPMLIDLQRRDALTSGLYITDIGYYPQAEDHYRQRLEPSHEYVLLYCVDGEGWYEVDGQHYTLPSNHFCILPAGKPHEYGASARNPWTIYWIHFAGTQAEAYASSVLTPLPIEPGNTSRINYRNTIFEEVFSTLSNSLDLESLRYASSTLHYYLASMRYLHHFRGSVQVQTDVVEAILHYMDEHLAHHLHMEQLAQYTGYSVQHLSMLFRKKTGLSPLAYFNEKKVRYAAQVLRESDVKVNQVCHQVGIDDAFYFSRLFKRIMGVSPKQWKAGAE